MIDNNWSKNYLRQIRAVIYLRWHKISINIPFDRITSNVEIFFREQTEKYVGSRVSFFSPSSKFLSNQRQISLDFDVLCHTRLYQKVFNYFAEQSRRIFYPEYVRSVFD